MPKKPNRWHPDLCCLRCGRPILKDRQACYPNGRLYPYAGCVAKTPEILSGIINVDGLLLNVARHPVKPVPILEDPYATS